MPTDHTTSCEFDPAEYYEYLPESLQNEHAYAE